MKNFVNKEVKNCKAEYYSDLITKNKGNPSELWKTFNEYFIVLFAREYFIVLYSTFRARLLACSEVISQVLFTTQQPEKNKMAFVAIFSQKSYSLGR